MDTKDFVECFLFDMYGWFITTMELDLNLSEKLEPKRCLPMDFHKKLLEGFAYNFVPELMGDIKKLPVLLCWSPDLFCRFADSVCLKLVQNGDPNVDFLKVMAFLMVIMAMSFSNNCYRWLDEIPRILETLLKERIRTKFFLEDGFDAILLQCKRFQEDDSWCKSTLEEIRACIKDSFEVEFAATKLDLCDELIKERTKIKISEAEFHDKFVIPDSKNCPLCAIDCFLIFRASFKPSIVYKPEHCLQPKHKQTQ